MSTTTIVLILAGCVALIGAVYVIYKRATKAEDTTSVAAKQ
jgi:hypothetical protein